MYKSPIEIKLDDIVSDAVRKADEYIVRYIQKIAVNVDKDELIKALKFDRGQYEKGWKDRDSEIVRCKDCRYCVPFRNRASGMCERKHEWYDGVENIQECFCSWGERREDADT